MAKRVPQDTLTMRVSRDPFMTDRAVRLWLHLIAAGASEHALRWRPTMIARELHCSASTVKRALERLSVSGYLIVFRLSPRIAMVQTAHHQGA